MVQKSVGVQSVAGTGAAAGKGAAKGSFTWMVIPVVLVVGLGLAAWYAPAVLKLAGGSGRSNAGCVSPAVSPSASGGYTCGSRY